MVSELSAEHLKKPFPDECRGMQVDGVDLVLLDSTTAGCIEMFLTVRRAGRNLDPSRSATLRDCSIALRAVIPTLQGKSREWFARLETLAQLVLDPVEDVPKHEESEMPNKRAARGARKRAARS